MIQLISVARQDNGDRFVTLDFIRRKEKEIDKSLVTIEAKEPIHTCCTCVNLEYYIINESR